MRTEAASALRFGCLAAVLLSAPAQAVPNDAPLTVAVREAPPFAMRGDAFALPDDSPHRNRLDVALLQVMRGEAWADVRARHLGDPEGD
jgi:hypothetical protein